ncbi:IQ motif and SEC7 domain-containing protein 1 [Melipona quadrifasciata]|uniref:IQ motif and SEC7 domain-containing protein 1 n=1 Tax=Melipona quadrifasciata TaxID=166423 RepID=A0A0M8ZRF8_9HYME|nr:IQ motif and SEC7 domain-containing protein 1 [Melipona quadrifasciata]
MGKLPLNALQHRSLTDLYSLNRYELSQDLLDKQIEMLERKYGGVKARNAALTIQRAFRRYTLLKKFAAITAMAKAENETLCSIRQETPPRDLLRTPCTSPSTPHNLQTQAVQNWSNAGHLGSAGRTRGSAKKVPPEVPKRTSSITSRSMEPRHNGLSKSVENGSLSSVQSSGSDSTNCESSEGDAQRGSPVWKHKGIVSSFPKKKLHTFKSCIIKEKKFSRTCKSKRLLTFLFLQSSSPEHQECANHATDSSTMMNSVKDLGHSHASSGYQLPLMDHPESMPQTSYKVSETVRKRQYRVGLNLFNKKPERGISYLIRRGFLENSPQGVARFLISRKGLSKQMIGEYLGNLQNPFNMAVLDSTSFCYFFFERREKESEDRNNVSQRKLIYLFITVIVDRTRTFDQRYCHCNPDVVSRLRSADTVFVLAFAIIMLNTDLHTPNLKPERRMRLDDFVKNLRGIDDCGDIDRDILVGIYERVKENEFKPGSDHVSQVMKVQATIVGKKPNMALPHRRLVCYCRLYEIPDIHKKERPGVHQREVFLFNDLLVVTKILSKKKNSVTYTFRQSFPLCGMVVTLFEVPHYPYGIRLSQRVDGKVLVTFNARNAHDRCKFVEDLRESISEMDEMETLRIETELERQKSSRSARGGAENRDSGVADVEICPCPGPCSERSETTDMDTQLKRSALSNSLLDIHEQFAGEKPQRRGSVGSLDSGMSISFQSTSASSMSQGIKHPGQVHPIHPGATIPGGAKGLAQQPSFLGGLFAKRERKLSQSEESGPYSRTTEV